jgi:multidrug resistance efflux pump
MSDEINKIELRSEEVQEILGNPPAKIIRYGITVIFIIVTIIIIGSFFFTYPDILTAPIKIISLNPPAILSARINGTIEQIMVSDSQNVNAGEVLAIIRNPANFQDITKLQTFLDSLKEEPLFSTEKNFTSFPSNLQLGSIQEYYSSLLKTIYQYNLFLKLDYTNRKIASLKKKGIALSKYIRILEKQSKLIEYDHQINIMQFNHDSVLLNQNLTSKYNFDNLQKTLLQSEMEYERSLSSVESAYIQQEELCQNIEKLTNDRQREIARYQTSIDDLLFTLKAQLSKWKDSYTLQSPIEGIEVFAEFCYVNQIVSSGDELFIITPKSQSNYVGRIAINSSGGAKMRVGQRVIIKFDDFPSSEFGFVTGLIGKISTLQSGRDYIVDIILPDNLTTNNNNILPYRQNMSGTAEIVTESIPFILRLFYPMKSVLKKNK